MARSRNPILVLTLMAPLALGGCAGLDAALMIAEMGLDIAVDIAEAEARHKRKRAKSKPQPAQPAIETFDAPATQTVLIETEPVGALVTVTDGRGESVTHRAPFHLRKTYHATWMSHPEEGDSMVDYIPDELTVRAVMAGHQPVYERLVIPGEQTELALVLQPAPSTHPGSDLRPISGPVAIEDPGKLRLAIFPIQVTTGVLDLPTLSYLVEYLASCLRLEGLLVDKPKATGSAEKTGPKPTHGIDLHLAEIEDQCYLSATLFDLMTGSIIGTTGVRTECGLKGLLSAQRKIAKSLKTRTAGSKPEVSPAVLDGKSADRDPATPTIR